MEIEPGTLIDGRYLTVRALKSGGMGAVYIAVDQKFEKDIALKIAFGADARVKARFKLEAIIGNKLGRVTGFVRAFDWGEDEGRLYLAMDLIQFGQDLDLESGTLEERLDRFRQAAALVAEAHRKGVLHRDLKPANYLQTPEGVIHLADFGLGKLMGQEEEPDSSPQLTGVGAAMGTPIYMPPEQFKDAAGVDRRADVYALGVMLFQLLTGSLPYPGKTPSDVISQQQAVVAGSKPAPRCSDHVADVDGALDELCARAIALDKDQRLASVDELLAGLPGGGAVQNPQSVVPQEPLAGPSPVTVMTPLKLGSYRVTGALARVAGGELFRGVHSGGEHVWLLRLDAGSQVEARLKKLEKLDHEGLAPLREQWTEDDVVCLAFSVGVVRTLDEWLGSPAGRKSTAAARIDIIADVARAMEYVHERGLALGCLSSHSVGVTELGRPRLVLTQLADHPPEAYLEADTAWLRYRAPDELCGGDMQAADIYSVGCLVGRCFGALTDEEDHGAPGRLLERIVHMGLGDAKLDDPDNTQLLERVFYGATSRVLSNRYPTTASLLEGLGLVREEMDPFGRATAAFLGGDYPEALVWLEQLLAAGSTDPEVHYLKARCYLAQNNQMLAIKSMRKAAEQGPHLRKVHVDLAKLWMSRKDTKRALKSLHWALRLDPQDQEGWMLCADLHSSRGETEDAEACFRAARDINPFDLQYGLRLAEFQLSMGKPEDARSEVQATLRRAKRKRDPVVAELYRLRGKIDFRLNDLGDAITAYERSLLINALDPMVHYELAMALSAKERFKDAIRALQKCLELDPHFSDARSYYQKLRQDYGGA